MRLYLDEDSASALLVRLQRSAGHDMELPDEVDIAGRNDPVHLLRAVREQ